MVYAVNYDLKQPNRDYAGVFEAIKTCGDWWHYLESTWLLESYLAAEQIWDRLLPHVHPKDRVLIHAVGRDHQGWLPRDAWAWISSSQRAVL